MNTGRTAHPAPRLRLTYLAYQVVAHLLAPVMIAVFLWRSRKEPLYRAGLGQRFGGGDRHAPGSIWIFAASLGETRAVSPVVERLAAQGQRILLTHSSPAGLKEGRRLFAALIAEGTLTSAYMPIDLFWAVARFLRRSTPRLGLVVESEIWPALLVEAMRRDIPMVQVNGNLTDVTLDRDRRGLGAMRLGFLGLYSRILTKSERLRANYLAAGLPAAKIEIVGELKFDQTVDPGQAAAAAEIRQQLPPGHPVVMIASSVEDEEPQIDRLVTQLLAHPVAPVVLWVPRSPQRFDAVADRLTRIGAKVLRRSEVLDDRLAGTLPADARVVLGDSLGEMAFYYGLSDLVFVGGSLNGHGGHNIIEPLAQGRPVVMGPSVFGIRFPAMEAADAGVFESLPNIDALIARVIALLEDPEALAAMAARAEAFHKAHLGASDRTLAALAPYLGSPSTSVSAPEASTPAVTKVDRDRPSRLDR